MEAWREELYHHGILGQKWGKQNGPPYPLGPGDHSAAERKKNPGLLGKIKERKRKKLRAQALERARKAKAARAEERRRQEEHDANRDKVVKTSTDASEILKYKDEMTSQEMQEAINRINNVNTLKQLSAKNVKDGWAKADETFEKIGKLTNYAKKGAEAYNIAAKTINAFGEMELPIIGAEKKKDNKNDKKSKDATAEAIKQEQLKKYKEEVKQAKTKTKSDDIDYRKKKREARNTTS